MSTWPFPTDQVPPAVPLGRLPMNPDNYPEAPL